MTKQETISIKISGKVVNRDVMSEEMDTKRLQLIELIDIQKKYDEKYLESLIDKATPRWEEIDADEWLSELREDNE